MGNKKGNKKGKGKEEGKIEEGVMNLIKKVGQNEKGFLQFMCATPSDEEMNKKFIPQPSVATPSIIWCSNDRNLTMNPEWAEAWEQFCISKEINWYESAFSCQREEVQNEGIEFMVDFVRKTRRSLMYKKYEYALQKKKKEEAEIDELNRQVELDLEYIEGHKKKKDIGNGEKKKKEQAKIDKDKGIWIKEEKKRADWSTAENDNVDDNTTIHGGGESAKSGKGKTVDEAKEDEGVVEVAGAEEKEKERVKEKVIQVRAEKEGVKEKVVEVGMARGVNLRSEVC